MKVKSRISQLSYFYLFIGTLLLTVSCSSGNNFVPNSSFGNSFQGRLSEGDRHVGWALTYYESWRRDRQPRYLMLAEEHIQTAVSEFASLQLQTSPRINEFYVIRERRVRSCRFLAEMQFEAGSYGYAVGSSPSGCMF